MPSYFLLSRKLPTCQSCSTRHGPIISGSQSAFSSVNCLLCFKVSATFHLSTALSEFLIPITSSLLFLLSPSASFYVHAGSLLECAGQAEALKEMDFSALNVIWQLEYAIHNLSYPPNWKAREKLNAVEGSAVCFF